MGDNTLSVHVNQYNDSEEECKIVKFIILTYGHLLSESSWVWDHAMDHYLHLNGIMCDTCVIEVLIFEKKINTRN